MSSVGAAPPPASRPDGAQDPYERPADAPRAIVLDYVTLLVFPLYIAAAWSPRSMYTWLGGLLTLGVALMAFGLARQRRRGNRPENRFLGAVAFDALASAVLLWLLADRIAVHPALHTTVVALLAVIGVLYAYSMLRMPRHSARAWSPLWDR